MNVEHAKGLREIPVKIKRLHPDAVIPKYATDLAAGFDLVAVEDVIIAPGETKLVPLGFAVEIPEGFEMQIRPRSGVTWKTKLRVGNSPGTIDADFRSEVKVIVDNISREGLSFSEWVRDITGSPYGISGEYEDGTYIVRKGDRLAQGVIVPVCRADFIEVDVLSETGRGDGGFGSTGVGTGGVNVFEKITRFDDSDLNGKTLEMYYTKCGGMVLLAGRDVETGVIYVIRLEKEVRE
ncbi:dUTP diphosphatase [Paenibacillus sp. ACRRX]|uniref:dUTP diphosphatase n=1 Tax=Paenibacillus sp. ACRRX TaxID=2918206 RepID=UPI0031BB94DF